LTYDDILQERVVFGTPSHVAARLQHLRETLGLSGFIVEPNVGGALTETQVEHSLDLLMREVVPSLRESI
jgi:alkanesulfonate monooxygenase SsuD/methylene tetrahydromethanopterin reductase-like flavin-dependent oxidoreductase (luciferase family)